MQTSAFKQVDVFTARRFAGNALAVILDAQGLDAADMQRIAAWTNLSETTFVLPPTQAGAHYRVRIFTPREELPFAGHPSVGTAHALLEAGRIEPQPGLTMECAAGLLPVEVSGDGAGRRIFVRAPRARLQTADRSTLEGAAAAIGAGFAGAHPPQFADNGPVWLVCDLGDEARVRALAPDMTALSTWSSTRQATGIAAFGRAAAGSGYALAVRCFAPFSGVPEDPVTGSANACIGAWLHATGQLEAIGATYRASQGREIGRDGSVDVRVDTATGDVDIGGQSVTCIDGTLVLPIE